MTKYVALLRGINVGGKTKVSMESLRNLFEGLGFNNVRTFINSGNVLFESEEAQSSIEQTLNHEITKSIGIFKTIVRTVSHLKQIASLSQTNMDKTGPLFITFFLEKPKKLLSKAPEIEIIKIKGSDVLWLRQEGAKGYADIERLFGITGTTRGLNTVKKLSEI